MYESGGLKTKNLMTILTAMDANGESTAAQLVEQTGLSVATISRSLSLLKEKKLIVQRRKDATEVGRKPEVFGIHGSYGYALYYCLEGGALRGYLLDLTGKLAARCSCAADAETTVPEFLEKLLSLREQLLSVRKKARVLAVMLAIPGLADVDSGQISRIPNYPNFENCNLAGRVSSALGRRCFVYNTSRLSALGEYLSAGEEGTNLVYLDITDTCGIGAGIILGGRLYEDRNALAGEVGDMVIDFGEDMALSSGSEGALERRAGLSAVFREACHLLQGGFAPQLQALMEQHSPAALNLTLLEKAAMAMDLDIYDLLNRTAKIWAAAIVNITALLAPDTVIVGGAVHSGHKLTEKMVRHHLSHMYHKPIHLKFAKKDAGAHVAGAAYLSRKYLLELALGEILEG